MNQIILEKLKEIEQKENVQIVLAVESGSRAWGFASPDSDYDVRFIYVRQPKDYLRVKEIRDVLEYPINDALDISGWDLKKTLQLLHSSNPSLFEWANSPIVYHKSPLFESFKQLLPQYVSNKKCLMHYLHMAKKNYHAYLTKKDVILKKYFYVLRPIFAAMWLTEKNEFPPIEFDILFEAYCPNQFKSIVNDMVERKKHMIEKETIPQNLELNQWILDTMEALNNGASSLDDDYKSWDELDDFFYHTLKGLSL